MKTHLGTGTALLTYRPAWTSGMRPLTLGEYRAGMGSVDQRIAWADTQTGYHDMRAAICLAHGLTVDQINPCRGTALVALGGAG